MSLRMMIRSAVRCGLLCTLVTLFLAIMSFAQSGANSDGARSVLLLTEPEQRDFVKSVMDAGFPDATGDRFSLLLVNRSALVVPMLELRVTQELKRAAHSERLVELASALIAYAGDEESLRAVARLIDLDKFKFGSLVGQALDNAANWRNPFSLAYYAVEMPDKRITELTVKWVEASLESSRRQRFWAEAMLEKYRRVPTESDWETDPIASRLTRERATEMKRQVLSLASEVHRQRDERK